jgi:hypothetical protein
MRKRYLRAAHSYIITYIFIYVNDRVPEPSGDTVAAFPVLWYNIRGKLRFADLSGGDAACEQCSPAVFTASQKCPCKQAFLLHGRISKTPKKRTANIGQI